MSGAKRTLHSETETAALAGEMAATLKPGMTLALCGPLGAGKTTFVGHLAAALGSGVEVSSPSYVLCHEYELASGGILEHWDVYRLSHLPPELEEPAAGNVLRVVEWADKFPEFLAETDCRLNLTPTSAPEVREAEIFIGHD